MDSLITAAARALAQGDVLGALKRISLRNDAAALALRGIAMAQLGDFERAKTLLRRAARDLTWPAKALEAARATLERQGDRANAAHARLLAIRRLVLIGRLDDA